MSSFFFLAACVKLTCDTLQGPSLIHITPLLSTDEARTSMQPAIDFVTAHGGSVTIQEFPSYLAFFNQYVTAAQAVRASFPLSPDTQLS